MKTIKKEKKRVAVIWEGQQNSKTPPLKLLVDPEQTYCLWATYGSPSGSTFIFPGTAKEESPLPYSYKVLAVPNPAAETFVICMARDVVVESGEAAIKTRNTGGYKNTGCQAILVAKPGTVLCIYGYNRRTWELVELTPQGTLKEIEDEDFIGQEDAATWADIWPTN